MSIRDDIIDLFTGAFMFCFRALIAVVAVVATEFAARRLGFNIDQPATVSDIWRAVIVLVLLLDRSDK